jgi:hypothetical protein
MGSPRAADWREPWSCQGLLPSPRWPARVRKQGGARPRLPAAAAGGKPGEDRGSSPEGVATRPEDPRMPTTGARTSRAGKGGRGLQSGGGGRQARQEGTTEPCWSEDLRAQGGRAGAQGRPPRRGALRAQARLEGWSKRRGSRWHVGERTEGRHSLTEGSRPHCMVPELEAVRGKTHRTAF